MSGSFIIVLTALKFHLNDTCMANSSMLGSEPQSETRHTKISRGDMRPIGWRDSRPPSRTSAATA